MHLVDNPYRFTDAYRARIAAALNQNSETTDQLRDAAKMIDARQPERIKGMIESRGGKFAIMIDEANAHFGWTFRKDANGIRVSGRKTTDVEMHAARTHAHITNQQ
ncbi:hypothetical protein [Pseudomonas koreensis]|uniref:hypothetical protein n=1 Tax=Pseudomonas koreensis TaxID=198620 RepID=UPI003207D153